MYATKDAVKKSARNYERIRNVKLRWYECKFCKMWHLTSTAKITRQTRREAFNAR